MSNSDSDNETSELPWALARPSSKVNSKVDMRRNVKSKYRVDELQDPPPRIPGVRSLLPLPGGDLLTGGTDLKIRRWDHYRLLFVLRLFVQLVIPHHWSYMSNWQWFFYIAARTEVIVFVGRL